MWVKKETVNDECSGLIVWHFKASCNLLLTCTNQRMAEAPLIQLRPIQVGPPRKFFNRLIQVGFPRSLFLRLIQVGLHRALFLRSIQVGLRRALFRWAALLLQGQMLDYTAVRCFSHVKFTNKGVITKLI